jgi:hypothetical protein
VHNSTLDCILQQGPQSSLQTSHSSFHNEHKQDWPLTSVSVSQGGLGSQPSVLKAQQWPADASSLDQTSDQHPNIGTSRQATDSPDPVTPLAATAMPKAGDKAKAQASWLHIGPSATHLPNSVAASADARLVKTDPKAEAEEQPNSLSRTGSVQTDLELLSPSTEVQPLQVPLFSLNALQKGAAPMPSAVSSAPQDASLEALGAEQSSLRFQNPAEGADSQAETQQNPEEWGAALVEPAFPGAQVQNKQAASNGLIETYPYGSVNSVSGWWNDGPTTAGEPPPHTPTHPRGGL